MYTNRNLMISKTVLAPTNAHVDKINEFATEMMQGNSMTLLSEDDSKAGSSPTARGGNLPVEYLNTLKPFSMPPHQLTLKRFQPIICLRNLSPQDGFCKGTRLIVRNVSRRYLMEAEIAVGDFTGAIQHIPRIVLHTDGNGTLPLTLKRKQFHVQPAFDMTVNKSQGQTLNDDVAVCLLYYVFAH